LEVRNLVVGVEPGQYITAEDIANKLRAKKSMVELCFHRLNLEGILSQGYNQAPHDSTRDRHMWGVVFGRGDSSWQATVYKKISVIQQENER
jgi:predicted transcriptional regulator